MTQDDLLPGYERALCRRCPDCGNLVSVERETGAPFYHQVECPYCLVMELQQDFEDQGLAEGLIEREKP